MFSRDQPVNDLPPLPPAAEVETSAVSKKAIAANRVSDIQALNGSVRKRVRRDEFITTINSSGNSGHYS
jgi:hypothetical protein